MNSTVIFYHLSIYSPSQNISIFGFCNIQHETLSKIFMTVVLTLLHPHLYVSNPDSVHLVQYNLLKMGILYDIKQSWICPNVWHGFIEDQPSF